jgi:hypothetical protein
MLYRTGLPGNLTSSITLTDSNGNPTGSGIIYATVNGSAITDNTNGAWVNFTFNPEGVLNKNTNYSIVVGAPNGNSNDYLTVLCNDVQLYTGGSFAVSNNGGSTWTKNLLRSALFIVNGNPSSISVDDVKVFENIFEPNDRLFVVNYEVNYLLPPHESPGSLFSVVLLGFAARPLNFYNYSVISIYLSAANATVWKDPETIWIEGNSTLFNNGLMRATYSVTDYSYVDSSNLEDGRSGLWSYILSSAGVAGYYGNTTYTFSSIYYGTILNTDGCILFESAIPGLGTIFPLVGFYLSKTSTEGAYFNYTQASTNTTYSDTLGLGVLGTKTDSAFNGLASYLSIPSGFLKGLFALFLYAIIASIVYLVSGDSVAALILAFPIICYGVIIGLIPMAILFVFAFLMGVAMAYYIWLH